MNSLNPSYRRFIFLAITLIALGVTFSTTMENVKSLGTVLIAVGGLFFIIGMSRKRDEVEDTGE